MSSGYGILFSGENMKLSVAAAVDNAPDNAFVVFRGVENSIRNAAELGYNGIELALARATDVNPVNFAKCLADYRMDVSAISTGLVYAKEGLSLLETPEEAGPVFRELINLAADFGKQVNIGRSRGFKRSLTPDQAAEKLKKTLEPLAEYASTRNVTMLLEPVNRYEIDWIHNVGDAFYILEKMGLPGIGIMPDVFHMNIEDRSIPASFNDFRHHIKYVHLADSNRHAPGWGHLDFTEIFSALKKTGYDKWVSVEILPVPNPMEAAKQAADFLRPLL